MLAIVGFKEKFIIRLRGEIRGERNMTKNDS